MRARNARYSADPGDAQMQGDLICAPQLMIVDEVASRPERRLRARSPRTVSALGAPAVLF
jgi:hypothetical protein